MNDLVKFLSEGYPILLFTKLFLGAVAVFFAIIVWSKTKRLSMILFVLGMFLMYISILTDTLTYFGFINTKFFTIGSLPLQISKVFSDFFLIINIFFQLIFYK